MALAELSHQEDIPGPATELCVMFIPDLRSITELVAVLICAPGFFVIKLNGFQTKLRQGAKLRGFGDSIVVCVLPETQGEEDAVLSVDLPVGVAALLRLVKLGERKEAVRC